MALVDIDVVAVNRNPRVVEFLFDVAIVIHRTTESPVAQLLARLRRRSRSVEARLDPGRVQFDHAESVLHEPLDQRAAVVGRHCEVVIAEWLQAELNAADERTVAGTIGGRRA